MTDTSESGGDNVALAITAILVTSVALALGDAIIKQISAGFLLWQIFVLRSAIAIPVVAAIAKSRNPTASLMPAAPGWTALRSLMLVLMWVAYYAALPQVPLSAAAAVYYKLPLFITLFASMFVGERVGAVGWLAVFIGFAGVLAWSPDDPVTPRVVDDFEQMVGESGEFVEESGTREVDLSDPDDLLAWVKDMAPWSSVVRSMTSAFSCSQCCSLPEAAGSSSVTTASAVPRYQCSPTRFCGGRMVTRTAVAARRAAGAGPWLQPEKASAWPPSATVLMRLCFIAHLARQRAV